MSGAGRIALLIQHIIAAGCPDIITLQENVTNEFVFLPPDLTTRRLWSPSVPQNTVELIKAQLDDLHTACDSAIRWCLTPRVRQPRRQRFPRPHAAWGRRGADPDPLRGPEGQVFPLAQPALAVLLSPRAIRARIKHPVERIDVFTTHQLLDADFGTLPCGVNVLPPPQYHPAVRPNAWRLTTPSAVPGETDGELHRETPL